MNCQKPQKISLCAAKLWQFILTAHHLKGNLDQHACKHNIQVPESISNWVQTMFFFWLWVGTVVPVCDDSNKTSLPIDMNIFVFCILCLLLRLTLLIEFFWIFWMVTTLVINTQGCADCWFSSCHPVLVSNNCWQVLVYIWIMDLTKFILPSENDRKKREHYGSASVSRLHLYLPSSVCEGDEQNAEAEDVRYGSWSVFKNA